MPADPPVDRRAAGALLLGLAGAVAVRRGIDGWPGANSIPAAVAFTGLLLALAAAGAAVLALRPARPEPGRIAVGVLAGIGGAAVLCVAPLIGHLVEPGPRFPLAWFAPWAAAVTGVAVAEELVLRGVLWSALERWRGPTVALAVTTVGFAVLHIPFYGWGSLPVNLAAGLLLGGLRRATGGVTAPALAHVLADLAGWWLQ